MIFVTVGTQFPFPRLIRMVDLWAGDHPEHECFAQIGSEGDPPVNMAWSRSLDAEEVRDRTKRANCVVSHAGMGTVLSCRDLGIPLVVVPRLLALGEHRSDHQEATARALTGFKGLYLLGEDADLDGLLAQALSGPRGQETGAPKQLLELQQGLSSWIRDPLLAGRPAAGAGS